MKEQRVLKIINLILKGGTYGRYDLTGVRFGIKRLEENKHVSNRASAFLEYVGKLREKVIPYIDRSLLNTNVSSDCGLFQSYLKNKLQKKKQSSIDQFLNQVKHGVHDTVMYHFTFNTSNAGGHFFSILLRPGRKPYIIQQEINTYNIFEYVLYNLLRGIKNPLSKDRQKICDFFEQARNQKKVNVNLYAYMFGYVWGANDETNITIHRLHITETTEMDHTCNFNSFLNSHSPDNNKSTININNIN